jgi:hypothetical protein
MPPGRHRLQAPLEKLPCAQLSTPEIIMKHLSAARFLSCFLLALCSPLLSQCGGDASLGTETGNPPRLQLKKLFLLASLQGVELVGEAGAVSAGASVSITNLSSGANAETVALANGSVDMFVAGSLDDEYDVTATSAEGASSSARLTPSASGGGNPLAQLSCEALDHSVRQRVAGVMAAIDRSCSIDSECVTWTLGACGAPGAGFCEQWWISASALSAARAQTEQETTGLCSALDRCDSDVGGCIGGFPVPDCQNGVCQHLDLNVDLRACESRADEARARLQEELEHADRRCSADDDCRVLNPHLTCVADCGNWGAAAQSAAPGVEQRIQDVDLTFCQSFDCPTPSPLPCEPLPEPMVACNAGQCELVFGQP